MKKVSLVMLLVTLFSCSTQQSTPNDRSEWPPMGYTDFSKNIQTTAGTNSLNCGFIDLTKRINKEVITTAQHCISYAIANNQAFKFGTSRIPIDSFVYRVLVLSPQGDFWDITLDRMLDNSDIILTLYKCSNVEINSSELLFEGKNCQKINNDTWPKKITH